MKKNTVAALLLVIMLLSAIFGLISCDIGALQGNQSKVLPAPENVKISSTTLTWNPVENAVGYTVKIVSGADSTANYVGDEYMVSSNSYSLEQLADGEYTIFVKSRGDSVIWSSSEYSEGVNYTRRKNTGADYKDDVIGAFGAFDEINTRESYLGYGVNIIDATGITSRNIKITYPIFKKDALLAEMLLKSNEHYSNLETVEAKTIEEFKSKLSNSASISAGASVSASGNIYGADVGGSVSMSQGIGKAFEHTTSETYSQYFLEIIAENQNYWLILQTDESRYKDILSDEFKKDLYDTSITPAQLFDKYGTHLLTSVAMGGNITMFYTLYSYSEEVEDSHYLEISSSIKTSVDAAYGSYSGGVSSDMSFSDVFTYEELAKKYNIRIGKQIITSGGSGSFGIINEPSLFNNYADWQKSLDAYPVVVGIKDSNSLYPIWNLIDTSISGGVERYNELYSYFSEYGKQSYENLCDTFEIKPPVAPTDIVNITAKHIYDYMDGEIIQVKPGDNFKITFDVLPDNANKYKKTFLVKSDYVTIDESGNVVVSENAPSRTEFTVTVRAGTVEREIKFYVVESCTIVFNTGFSELSIPNVILESGSLLNEPEIFREGFTLDGWYKDANYEFKFDFITERVTKNIILYAKWSAIEPVITFNTLGGSEVDSQKLKYNTSAKEPVTPYKDGYKFMGWYSNLSCTDKFDFSTLLKENTTLYAAWELINYTVTFDTLGGVELSPKSTNINLDYKISEIIPTRAYYEFGGWYRDVTFAKRFYFEESIIEDTILYAKWIPINVTVNFVDTDGGILQDESGISISSICTNIESNFRLSGVAVPYKIGYEFVGWIYDGEIVDIEVMEFRPNLSSNEHSLVAAWDINEYKLIYKINEDTVKEVTYKYNEKISPFIPDEIKGYTFTGWDLEPTVMPAENVVVTGSYSINYYTVTYMLDGVQYGSVDTVKYGDAIVLRADPKDENKDDFSGWTWNGDDVPSTMPDENIIITGTFGSEYYDVNYYVDGQLYKTNRVCVNNVIPMPEPTKVGYNFIGWKNENGDMVSEITTMTSGDKVLNAVFEIKEITITVKYVFENGAEAKAPDFITRKYGETYSIEVSAIQGYTTDLEEIVGVAGEENLDIIITYKLKLCKLTIKYLDYDGKTLAVDTTKHFYGAPYSIPEKKFEGRSNPVITDPAKGIMPAEDHIVTVKYNLMKITVKVNFTISGDSVSKIDPIEGSYDYGKGYSITVPTRSGYTAFFKGTTNEATIITGTVNTESPITYNVEFIPKAYEIKYNLNSTSILTVPRCEAVNRYITYLTSPTLNIPHADYYIFTGWYDSNGTQIADAKGNLIPGRSGYTDSQGRFIRTSATTLHARWTQEKTDWIYIKTPDQLKSISKKTDAKYFLVEDIDMKGAEWTPIESFAGKIDGNGKCIFNFKITKTATGIGRIGFIAYNTGSIENLTIGKSGNSSFDGSYSVKYQLSYTEDKNRSYLAVGALVGENGSSGVINNCYAINVYFDATISDNNNNEDCALYIGGIVGVNSGTVKYCGTGSCKIYGVVKAKVDSGDNNYGDMGGICGVNDYVVSYCAATNNDMNLKVYGNGTKDNYCDLDTNIGGILGYQRGLSGNSTISYCVSYKNTMEGYCSEGYINDDINPGLVVGLLKNGKISNCYAYSKDQITCNYTDSATQIKSEIKGDTGTGATGSMENCAKYNSISDLNDNIEKLVTNINKK